MKTLFLSQRVPYPPNKGEKIRTFHQIVFLLNNKHNIFLCSPYASENELIHFRKFSQKFGVRSEHGKLGHIYRRYLSGLISRKPLSISNFYSHKLQKLIDNLIANESFQNIVCTSSSMAEYIFNSSSLWESKFRPKLVMDFMDLDSDKWRQYSVASKFPMKYIYRREAELLSKYEQRVYRMFDVCFFISQAEVDLFCNNTECTKKPLFIGNGVDTEYYFPAIQPPKNSHPVLIFTGVMDYQPNIDSVLWFAEYVWPKIINKYDKSRFIIAGMNPVPKVSALTNVQGIEVTGFVKDILPYYHQSDIFVAPFRIARGVQNKILQAFSCGLPVVATSMGAEGIECIDGENILIADSPDKFFDNIEKLNKNTRFYRLIKENALSLVTKYYSWNGRLKALGNILQ